MSVNNDDVLPSTYHKAGASWWNRGNVLLLSIIVTGVVLRLAFLNQNMRFDESQTFNLYVSQAPGELFHMTQLNNHLFHSLIVWLTTLCVGSAPWALRLPAFLAGIAAIPLTFRLCRELNDNQGGLVGAMGMAVFPFLVLFSTNARGYTILMCLMLLLAISIVRFLRDPVSVPLHRLSLLTALGLWTHPSMAYPAAGLLFWFILELFTNGQVATRTAIRHLIVMGLQILVLTSLMYAPPLLYDGGFDDVFHNPVIRSLPPEEFVSGIVPHIQKVHRHIMRDVPDAMSMALYILAGLGAVSMLRHRSSSAATLSISLMIGTGGLFLLKQSFPFTRNWMFLIPLALVHADIGFSWVSHSLPRTMKLALTVLILVPCVMSGLDLVQRDRISTYNDTGRFPEVVEVADFLAQTLSDDDVVVAWVPDYEPLTYYLRRRQILVPTRRSVSSDRRCFVVVTDRNKAGHMGMDHLQPVFKTGNASVFMQLPRSAATASQKSRQVTSLAGQPENMVSHP